MVSSRDIPPRFAPGGSISRPPSRGEILTDRAFRALAFTSGGMPAVALVGIVFVVLAGILWMLSQRYDARHRIERNLP